MVVGYGIILIRFLKDAFGGFPIAIAKSRQIVQPEITIEILVLRGEEIRQRIHRLQGEFFGVLVNVVCQCDEVLFTHGVGVGCGLSLIRFLMARLFVRKLLSPPRRKQYCALLP